MIVKKELKAVHYDDELLSHSLWSSVFLQLGNLPFTIAPESQDEALSAWEGVTLRSRFGPASFQAFADAASATITVDSGLVDGLWCMAVACYLLQQEYEQQSNCKDLTKDRWVLDPDDHRIDTVLRYISAALGLVHESTEVDWQALPVLDEPVVLGARQLTLCSCAFVLYHEFAHLTLAHSGAGSCSVAGLEVSRLNESDADNFALEYILGAPGVAGPTHVREVAFRAWGIVIATLMFCAREMARNTVAEAVPGIAVADVTDRTHPVGYIRLDRVLKHSAVDGHALVRRTMYSAACLPLYFLAVQNGAVPDLGDQSFRDMEALYESVADHLNEQLARLPKTVRASR